MKLHISEPFIWLPVSKKKPEVKLHFYCNDTKIQEVDIQLGGADRDFYTSMDVSQYLGQEIEIKGEIAEEELYSVFCHKEKVQNGYPFRPQLHFTPEIGWMNDPNGLVYADGVYHLYHQWNPYGIIWGNMHWGHAVSKDLIKWEYKPMAMEPDAYGTIYSGCGWQDRDNVSGFGKNALLFFYTASGGSNQWSVDAGNQHTQRLAVSLDGGETLKKTEGAVLEHIAGENRDPKIFYHHKSSAYVMVLFLDGNEFAIFRSKDLLHWDETQRFAAEGMWECPDLFELPVDHADGEKKWVFWSADGYYLVGDFDGYRFTPESEVLSAYSTRLPYAAQTYAGMEHRIVSVSWLRTEHVGGNYRGMMSLPTQLSLVKCENGYKIRFQLIEECLNYRQIWKELKQGERSLEVPLSGKPAELVLNWNPQELGHTKLSMGKVSFDVDFDAGKLEIQSVERYGEAFVITFDKKKAFDLDVVIDHGIIEFYGNAGVIYGAIEAEEDILRKTLVMESGVELDGIKVYELVKE